MHIFINPSSFFPRCHRPAMNNQLRRIFSSTFSCNLHFQKVQRSEKFKTHVHVPPKSRIINRLSAVAHVANID